VSLLAAGVRADVVSERLGHSNVGFTLSTYAHRLEADERAALARLRIVL
jgi:integrase